MTIDPQAHIGSVHLHVSEMDQSLEFYQRALGFKLHKTYDSTVELSAGNGHPLLTLTEISTPRIPQGRTGLYHFAILVPSRLELARSMRRLLEANWQPEGFADHGVSEAIYLSDPDRNGIEIYRDRSRSQWPGQNGQIEMYTHQLDLEGLMEELNQSNLSGNGLNPKTTIGHVHLKVRSVPEAEDFYTGVLGFDLIQHFGHSAGFVSAGGYHHHIGFNTWESLGAPPPPDNATGLQYFSILLPNQQSFEDVVKRLHNSGTPIEKKDGGLFLRDPSQIGILLASETGS